MSAYVIIEFTVKDPDVVREKYGPNAAQTVKERGGEVLANRFRCALRAPVDENG